MWPQEDRDERNDSTTHSRRPRGPRLRARARDRAGSPRAALAWLVGIALRVRARTRGAAHRRSCACAMHSARRSAREALVQRSATRPRARGAAQSVAARRGRAAARLRSAGARDPAPQLAQRAADAAFVWPKPSERGLPRSMEGARGPPGPRTCDEICGRAQERPPRGDRTLGVPRPFAVLAARAAHLAVIDRRGAAAGRRRPSDDTLPARRAASILDRNGAGLALSVEAPSVYAVPPRSPTRPAAARELAKHPRRERAELARASSAVGHSRSSRAGSAPSRARGSQAQDLAGIGDRATSRGAIYPQRALAAQRARASRTSTASACAASSSWRTRGCAATARRLPVERDGAGRLLLASCEHDPRARRAATWR